MDLRSLVPARPRSLLRKRLGPRGSSKSPPPLSLGDLKTLERIKSYSHVDSPHSHAVDWSKLNAEAYLGHYNPPAAKSPLQQLIESDLGLRKSHLGDVRRFKPPVSRLRDLLPRHTSRAKHFSISGQSFSRNRHGSKPLLRNFLQPLPRDLKAPRRDWASAERRVPYD